MLKMIVLYVCVLSGNELLSKLIATLNSLFSHFVVRTNPVLSFRGEVNGLGSLYFRGVCVNVVLSR